MPALNRRQKIDLLASTPKALTKIHQNGIDQFQLALDFLLPFATQIIEDSNKLAHERFG